VQVDPFDPTLKATGSKRLKLEDEKMLSNFTFRLNLRRYTKEEVEKHFTQFGRVADCVVVKDYGSVMVGRCRLIR